MARQDGMGYPISQSVHLIFSHMLSPEVVQKLENNPQRTAEVRHARLEQARLHDQDCLWVREGDDDTRTLRSSLWV